MRLLSQFATAAPVAWNGWVGLARSLVVILVAEGAMSLVLIACHGNDLVLRTLSRWFSEVLDCLQFRLRNFVEVGGAVKLGGSVVAGAASA